MFLKYACIILFAMANRITNSKRFKKLVNFSYAGYKSGSQFLKGDNIQKLNSMLWLSCLDVQVSPVRIWGDE